MPSASSNWLQLQKKIAPSGKSRHHRRKRESTETINASTSLHDHNDQGNDEEQASDMEPGTSSSVADNSPKALRKMVEGYAQFTDKQRLPGKYLALDCEMVGVGPEGAESSLARVSIVNFYGAVVMDEFVKQRERVVDYRTQWSGVRAADMVHAKPFDEVQKRVAELLENRILVGHAVHNDLKALLLSHPYPLTRDTQVLAYKSKVTKSKRVALRNLVKDEVGIAIQGGEHSSVTDARATMAIYRIHKKAWDKLLGAFARTDALSLAAGKRKVSELEPDDDASSGEEGDDDQEHEEGEGKGKGKKRESKKARKANGNSETGGGGRKGVSSGLATIVRRGGEKVKFGKAAGGHVGKGKGSSGGKGGGGGGIESEKGAWWAQLPVAGGGGGPKKGSMRI